MSSHKPPSVQAALVNFNEYELHYCQESGWSLVFDDLSLLITAAEAQQLITRHELL